MRLRRIEGDWARVVVVPNIVTDHATMILRRENNRWKVVFGPGTAGYGPDELPGVPPALLERCPSA